MDMLFNLMPFVLMLLLLGCVAGFMAGLLGVGGGIVLVPGIYSILMWLQPSMGFDHAYIMHISVGTSLAVIVPTGFSSARAHYRKGGVDFEKVFQLGVGVVIGVVLATWIAKGLAGTTLQMIFACAIVVLAAIMVMGKKRFQSDVVAEPGRVKNGIAGVFIGGISTLIGIGGATLSVPYMSLHGTSIHRAIGTASALGLVISIPATIGFVLIGWGQVNLPPFSLGYVNIVAWACIIPMSVSIAPLGARAAHKVSVGKLRLGFAVFMVLVVINMWRKIIMGG